MSANEPAFLTDTGAPELPEGEDIMVTQFTITLLPKLEAGKPRPPRGSFESKMIIDVADADVPEGQSPMTVAMKLAAEATPRGMTSSVRRGARMARRLYASHDELRTVEQ